MNRWNPLLELPRLRKLSYAASIMIIDRNQQRLCTYVLTLLKNSRFKCKINTKTTLSATLMLYSRLNIVYRGKWQKDTTIFLFTR